MTIGVQLQRQHDRIWILVVPENRKENVRKNVDWRAREAKLVLRALQTVIGAIPRVQTLQKFFEGVYGKAVPGLFVTSDRGKQEVDGSQR